MADACPLVLDRNGACLPQSVNGSTTHDALELEAGLAQVLDDCTNEYLYGKDRIGKLQPGGYEYHPADALGSGRQLSDGSGHQTLASLIPFFSSKSKSLRVSFITQQGHSKVQFDMIAGGLLGLYNRWMRD